MPRFDLYSVDYDNDLLHMRLKGADSLDEAWTWADVISGFSPYTAAIRAYEGRLAALEARPGIVQFGLWHYQEAPNAQRRD